MIKSDSILPKIKNGAYRLGHPYTRSIVCISFIEIENTVICILKNKPPIEKDNFHRIIGLFMDSFNLLHLIL